VAYLVIHPLKCTQLRLADVPGCTVSACYLAFRPAGPSGSSAPIDVGHKGVVIRCLEAICDNGQLLVDIFVNYDCDLEGANLFERLVLAMVRIAQGNQDKDVQAAAGPEESGLRLTVTFFSFSLTGDEDCVIDRWLCGQSEPHNGPSCRPPPPAAPHTVPSHLSTPHPPPPIRPSSFQNQAESDFGTFLSCTLHMQRDQ